MGFDRKEGAPDTYHHGKKRRSSERNLWPGRKVYGGNGLLQDGYRSSDYTGSKKRGMEFRERFVNCDKRVRLSLHLNRRWGGGTVRFFSNFFSLSLSHYLIQRIRCYSYLFVLIKNERERWSTLFSIFHRAKCLSFNVLSTRNDTSHARIYTQIVNTTGNEIQTDSRAQT